MIILKSLFLIKNMSAVNSRCSWIWLNLTWALPLMLYTATSWLRGSTKASNIHLYHIYQRRSSLFDLVDACLNNLSKCRIINQWSKCQKWCNEKKADNKTVYCSITNNEFVWSNQSQTTGLDWNGLLTCTVQTKLGLTGFSLRLYSLYTFFFVLQS